MKATLLAILVPFAALAQAPIPTVPLETKAAYAITLTSGTNSPMAREAVHLSQQFLGGIISPAYYSNAIHGIYRSDQLSNIVSAANMVLAAKPKTVAVPITKTNVTPLAFSNQPNAQCSGLGKGSTSNNYYPAYNLQAMTQLNPKPFPTNLRVFPAGSLGFTNNVSSTNPQQFFRVMYAQ